MPGPLVLSLFPGIGLLDMAFESEGFCVVRGPDLLWGGDVKRFRPPAGKFDGVIGGPPCKAFSAMVHIVRAVHGEASVAEDLIPEFARCVVEAQPAWYVMENVPAAPCPLTPGYLQTSRQLNNRWFGGTQSRKRRFVLGIRDHAVTARGDWLNRLKEKALEPAQWDHAVTATAGGRRVPVALGSNGKPKGNQRRGGEPISPIRSLAEMCRLQGLPEDFLSDSPFTLRGKQEAVGNGVPLMMGRAIAAAIMEGLKEVDAVMKAGRGG